MRKNVEKISGKELMKEQITGRRKLEPSLVLITLHEDSCNVKNMICSYIECKTVDTQTMNKTFSP